MTDRMPVISVRDLVVGFGEAIVLDGFFANFFSSIGM